MTTATDSNSFASSYWERVFTLDLRSLAVFRIAVGLLLIFDVAMRWPDLRALYSDDGYFTRAHVNQYFSQAIAPDWQIGTWSLHLLRGDLGWAQTLFILQAVCGGLLILGFATRVVTLAAWILVVSAQIRGPLVITAGDFILKMMLFWGIFLPLARRWSLDRQLFRRWWGTSPQDEPNRVVSWASAAYVIQVVTIYFCTGEAKLNQIWWQGEAMQYVLHLDIHCRPHAQYLLNYPWLLKAIAWGTLFIECVLIWFLLSPWRNAWWRLVNIAAYYAFHLGILLWMSIGLFPWICFALWLPLLPNEFWRRCCGLVEAPRALLPPTGWLRWIYWPAQAFCCCMLALVVLWNVANFEWLKLSSERIPPPVKLLARVTAIDQRFQMFGVPPKLSAWFVYEARLKDGSRVDLFRPGHDLDFAKPASVLHSIPTHNWRQLHRNLTSDHLAALREGLLDYHVKVWNESHGPDQQVMRARLHCFLYETGPNQSARSTSQRIWKVWNSPDQKTSPLLDDLLDTLQDNPNHPF